MLLGGAADRKTQSFNRDAGLRDSRGVWLVAPRFFSTRCLIRIFVQRGRGHRYTIDWARLKRPKLAGAKFPMAPIVGAIHCAEWKLTAPIRRRADLVFPSKTRGEGLWNYKFVTPRFLVMLQGKWWLLRMGRG